MKRAKIYFSALILAVILFPNAGIAGGKDELAKKVTEFQTSFIENIYSISWGQYDGHAIMHITEVIVNSLSVNDRIISHAPKLAVKFTSNENYVSLIALAAMCLHYVPNERYGIILKLMMVLQASIFEVVKEHAPQQEDILNLISDQLKNINPEEKAKLIEGSQTITESASRKHHSGNNLFGCRPGGLLHALKIPLTLTAALGSTWTVRPLK